MKLYAHQLNIINNAPIRCGIFLGTGGGKTRIALSLARGSVLIIAPKTQVEDQNWQREMKKMNLYRDLTVISKENFRRDFSKLSYFDTVIADEVHTLCGVSPSIRWRKREQYPKASQLFEAFNAYLNKNKPERLYLLTATPTRQPMAVWALGKFLGKNWDFMKFRDAFYIQLPTIGRNVYKAKTDKRTKEKLGELVRLLGYTGKLEEWFDVPESTFKTEFLELNKQQKKRIEELKGEYPEPITLLGKTHQAENGIVIGNSYKESEELKNEKLERILDYAEEFPQLLIFAKYTMQIESIRKALEKAGKKVLLLTGETKDKGNVIQEANKEEECIVIAQSQISLGYELPTYPCVIYASLSWSQVDLIQSWGRVQRANYLKKNLYVYLVSKGGIDEAIYKTIMNKKDFNEAIYLKEHKRKNEDEGK